MRPLPCDQESCGADLSPPPPLSAEMCWASASPLWTIRSSSWPPSRRCELRSSRCTGAACRSDWGGGEGPHMASRCCCTPVQVDEEKRSELFQLTALLLPSRLHSLILPFFSDALRAEERWSRDLLRSTCTLTSRDGVLCPILDRRPRDGQETLRAAHDDGFRSSFRATRWTSVPFQEPVLLRLRFSLGFFFEFSLLLWAPPSALYRSEAPPPWKTTCFVNMNSYLFLLTGWLVSVRFGVSYLWVYGAVRVCGRSISTSDPSVMNCCRHGDSCLILYIWKSIFLISWENSGSICRPCKAFIGFSSGPVWDRKLNYELLSLFC